MKKTLLAIAAFAAAMVGCTQLETDQIATSDGIVGQRFYGYLDVDAETRTILDADNKINWETGDFVSVFAADDHNLKYSVNLPDGQQVGKSATFDYVEEFVEGTGVKLSRYYAIYPFAESNTATEAGVLSFNMPANIDGVTVNSVKHVPTVATSPIGNNKFYFKAPTALVRIRVSKENTPNKYYLNTLTLTSRKGQALAGDAVVDMSAEPYKASIAGNASSSVTLNFGAEEEGLLLTTTEQYVYFAIPEMTFEADDLQIGFTAYVQGLTKYGHVDKAPSITFNAGKVKATSLKITGQSFEGSTEDATSVANVNGVEYKSIEEAFEAAIALGGEQTISVTAPATIKEQIAVPAVSNISLILNNFEVTSELETPAFLNSGKLTILGGTISTKGMGVRVVANGAELTVGAGATIVSETSCAVFVPKDGDGSTVNVYGTLEGKGSDFATLCTNGLTENIKVNIFEDAVITSTGSTAVYCPGATINVEGGAISGAEAAIYHKKGALTIAGGEFTATGAFKAYEYNGNGTGATGSAVIVEACEYGAVSATITGGTFKAANGEGLAYYRQSDAHAATFAVSGGLYSTAPAAEVLGSEYRAELNADNMYEVILDVVTNTGYTSLADAVADAEEGATITIISNADEDGSIVIGQDIIIEGVSAPMTVKGMAKAKAAKAAVRTITSSALKPIIINQSNIKVILKDLHIVSTNAATTSAIVIAEGVTGVELVIENCSFEYANANAVVYTEGANVENHVTIDGVRQVYNTAELKAALKNWDVAEVKVNMLADASLNGYYTAGTAQTTNITIEGNGHTLTFETTYNAGLKALNEDAKVVLNNMNITTTKASGTWDTYDMMFDNSTELNNVNALKAIALCGENKTYTLNNVTIAESHDYYAMWVTAAGNTVTIDGLEITSDGRGIKIDEQYSTAATVNFNIKNATFETAKKAAIMVKSSADVNIVAENLDITKVAADQKFAVWVDEDAAAYYDLTTVTGCEKILEGSTFITDGLLLNAAGEYEVYSVNGLKWIAKEVNDNANTLKGKTVKLMNDIDLAGENWTPIGHSDTIKFEGIFNGQDNTIYNLNMVVTEAAEGKAYIGLFGFANNATIKNVIFENVNINIACLDIDHSQGHIGAVAGSLEGTSTIENVTVKGDVKVEATFDANGASRVAVVAGGNAYGNVTMKNVHVKANAGSYLKANNNVGALAGQLQGKNVFENCSSNINVTGKKFFAGGIIGLAAGDSQFTNCLSTGDIAITAGREGRANDHYRVGGIAGGWADGATKVCTLTNCSYTGKVSGTNADGSVAAYLDYAGYVGRGYTLNGCAGSKVVINGVEYVEVTNSSSTLTYKVNNVYEISNAASLKWLATTVNGGNNFAKQTVKLVDNIDLNNEEWAPIGKTGSFNGTFDGNGKTVRNLLITGNNSTVGLFGNTHDGEIKNLTVENAKVSGRLNVGVVAGNPYTSKYNNIKVCGHVEVNGMAYVGGVGGKNAYANWNNITVDVDATSYVKANSIENGTAYRTYVGGVVGFNGEGNHTFSNIRSNINVSGTTCDVGGAFGIAHYGNKFENVSVSGNVEITNAGDAGDAEQIGGIAGVWNNATGYSVTFNGCSFTGKLKTNMDMNVKVNLSNNTIVGDAYSATGEGKLYIDGQLQNITSGTGFSGEANGEIIEW